jgi:hypothetical protein
MSRYRYDDESSWWTGPGSAARILWVLSLPYLAVCLIGAGWFTVRMTPIDSYGACKYEPLTLIAGTMGLLTAVAVGFAVCHAVDRMTQK